MEDQVGGDGTEKLFFGAFRCPAVLPVNDIGVLENRISLSLGGRQSEGGSVHKESIRAYCDFCTHNFFLHFLFLP